MKLFSLFLFLGMLSSCLVATNFNYNFSANTSSTFLLNANDSITDLQSNNIIVANSSLNVFVKLKYSSCYNITDSAAKSFCEQVPANQPVLNYSNSVYNIAIIAPDFPIIPYVLPVYPRFEKVLTYGETYFNSTFNLTIKAPELPQLNVRKELAANEIYFDSTYNFTAICLKEKLECAAPIVCPAVVEPVYNTTTCKAVIEPLVVEQVNAKLLEITNITGLNSQFCYKVQDANASSCNATVMINNQTPICIDSLTDLCTVDEIKNGQWRNCFERFVKSERDQIASLQSSISGNGGYLEQIGKLSEQKNSLRDNSTFVRDVIVALAWLIFVVGLFYTGFKLFGGRQVWKVESEPPKGSSEELADKAADKVIERLGRKQ